jgi:shikimate kinase
VPDVVVLLGPPGSGKSTIGELLGRRGLRWREWEPVIVERWGAREAFLAVKAEALPQLHGEIRGWIAAGATPAVVESTGLSDADFLDGLERDHRCVVVRLDVGEDEAMARVAARDRDRHVTDDVVRNRAVWRAFHDGPGAHRRVDLAIDTERHSPARVADEVLAAYVRRAGGAGAPTSGGPAADGEVRSRRA